jgi:hypothetical protein
MLFRIIGRKKAQEARNEKIREVAGFYIVFGIFRIISVYALRFNPMKTGTRRIPQSWDTEHLAPGEQAREPNRGHREREWPGHLAGKTRPQARPRRNLRGEGTASPWCGNGAPSGGLIETLIA